MAIPFEIYDHRVYQPQNIQESHRAPLDSILLKLTVKAKLITERHNSQANTYSITNTSFTGITINFYAGVLENERRLRLALGLYLIRIGINSFSVNFDNLAKEIMECGLAMSDRVVNIADYVVLPLQVNIVTRYVEHDPRRVLEQLEAGLERIVLEQSEAGLERRVLEQSEAELERRNYGMVAAKGSSIEEMLKKVRIEDEIDCMVCLEKLKVGKNCSQMPCSHIFHTYCIKKWLKQSHYCPICRYEMPTND